MLSFLFPRYLSDNYEQAAKKELGPDYPEIALLLSTRAQVQKLREDTSAVLHRLYSEVDDSVA